MEEPRYVYVAQEPKWYNGWGMLIAIVIFTLVGALAGL